jgi:hypothetical protein
MLETLLMTAIPSLLPTVANGLRGLFNKFSGGAGAAPANAEEAVKIMEADTRRLEALARLDSVGDVHKWVNDVRGMMRPTVAILVICSYLATFFIELPEAALDQVLDFTRIVVFYLFGERTLMHLMKRDK